MSSDMKIPEWAEKAAFEAQTAAIEECKTQRLGANYDYPFVTSRSKEVLDRHIARALLAAEQRGRKAGRKAGLEEAADHLGQMAKDTPLGQENIQRGRSTYNWLRHCEAAIRSLGDKT